MSEVWKDIPGFDKYQASSLGRIKRLKHSIWSARGFFAKKEEKILSETISDRGYYRCCPFVNGRKLTIQTHRLVALAFAPGHSEILNEVNHKDGNKLNNRADNLEWSDRSGNILHAFANGLIKSLKGFNHGYSKIVLHTEYGIFCTITEAAKISGKEVTNMSKELTGKRINKTKFVLV